MTTTEYTTKITDKAKALEVVVGTYPMHSCITVNGKNWGVVKQLEIGVATGDDPDTMITFTCFVDDPQDFVGILRPTVDTPTNPDGNPIALQLCMNGRTSYCTFDGKRIHLTKATLYATATNLTELEIERQVLQDEGDPIIETTRGVFYPEGEQKIDQIIAFE